MSQGKKKEKKTMDREAEQKQIVEITKREGLPFQGMVRRKKDRSGLGKEDDLWTEKKKKKGRGRERETEGSSEPKTTTRKKKLGNWRKKKSAQEKKGDG